MIHDNSKQKNKEMKYRITVSKKQLQLLSEASDLLGRIMIGQIFELKKYLVNDKNCKEIDGILDIVKTSAFPELPRNSSYYSQHKDEASILLDFWECSRSILFHNEIKENTSIAPYPFKSFSSESLPEFEIIVDNPNKSNTIK